MKGGSKGEGKTNKGKVRGKSRGVQREAIFLRWVHSPLLFRISLRKQGLVSPHPFFYRGFFVTQIREGFITENPF